VTAGIALCLAANHLPGSYCFLPDEVIRGIPIPMKIVSLLPAATEIAAALGLMDRVVGVSHECDYPTEANQRPRVTHCPIHQADLSSIAVDQWVRRALEDNGTIYTIDDSLMRELQPDVILTQKLCDVCAVGYGTVARLVGTLPGPPKVVNLEPSCLSDIFADIQRVATACDVAARAKKLIAELSVRVEAVRTRARRIAHRPHCFLMEWVDPPFCSGHWGPELVEIAGGYDSLGRKCRPSAQIAWDSVVEARPEIIVLALCGCDLARVRRDLELLRNLPGFDSLPAVRNNAIYIVDGSAFFARPGPRIVDSLEILAGILHPEEFPEFISRGADDNRVVRAEIAGSRK
jgi:iron complex transport system substrate-binding protein